MDYKKVTDFAPLVRECYALDHELLDKFHIVAGTGLDNCVQNSLAVIADKSHKVKFYEVLEKGQRVGYFSAIKNNQKSFLNTFFVNPKYRYPQALSAYWNLIKKYFKKQSFVTAIYSKNTRAESFLLRGGCTVFSEAVVDGEAFKVFTCQN